MEPAKLSPQFVREPDVCLEDLKLDESGWVNWLDMAIDSEYRCYLDPKAHVTQLTLNTIRVTRTGDGFEVLIPASPQVPFRWRLGAYNPKADKNYARYVPVIKLEYTRAEEPSDSTESEKRYKSIERNLAITQEYSRNITEIQNKIAGILKEIDKI